MSEGSTGLESSIGSGSTDLSRKVYVSISELKHGSNFLFVVVVLSKLQALSKALPNLISNFG